MTEEQYYEAAMREFSDLFHSMPRSELEEAALRLSADAARWKDQAIEFAPKCVECRKRTVNYIMVNNWPTCGGVCAAKVRRRIDELNSRR